MYMYILVLTSLLALVDLPQTVTQALSESASSKMPPGNTWAPKYSYSYLIIGLLTLTTSIYPEESDFSSISWPVIKHALKNQIIIPISNKVIMSNCKRANISPEIFLWFVLIWFCLTGKLNRTINILKSEYLLAWFLIGLHNNTVAASFGALIFNN